jgi:hypothetical protein
MKINSKSYKILSYIAERICVDYDELLEYAAKVKVSRSYLNFILSYHAKNKNILRQWIYDKSGKKHRRYCINPNKVRVILIG